MSAFLQAVTQGDNETIKHLYDSNPDIAYEVDQNGHNALALAVLLGHWGVAITLLKYCRISPHAIDKKGNSLYHLVPLGLKARRPTNTDYAEIRAENATFWASEEQKERNRIADIQSKNPDIKAPENLLIKRASDLEREFFGSLDLFFPKYIMHKYHVVLNAKNSFGHLPPQVAADNGERELAEFYQVQLQPNMIRRRLAAGLNDNLMRDIASFL